MKVRIAGLHASDKKPVVGEDVVIRGYAQIYDDKKKMWLPLKARVKFLVDGMNYGTIYTHSNGLFEFTFSSNVKGRRKVEVILEDVCKKEIEIEFIDEREKKRIQRIGTIAVIVLIVLIVILYLIMVIV